MLNIRVGGQHLLLKKKIHKEIEEVCTKKENY